MATYFWGTLSAHLNNFVMGCWRELLQSESLLCERKAAGVAGDKLSFLQPQEFSSSGNRKWSAPPDDKNNTSYVSNQNCSNHESMHALPIVLYTKNLVLNYSLFAGQKVFPDAEEILSILSQAFDEAFL